MILCNTLYYPKPPLELNNPYATPLIATLEQLSGLPPTLLITAECDILRDEGEAYGNRLTEAGVEVCALRVLNTTHGFMTSLGPATPQYTYIFKTIVNFINDNLGL
jgi:acetyl esterase